MVSVPRVEMITLTTFLAHRILFFSQIDIDFALKFPLAKDIKITWTSLENKLFTFLKAKLPNSTLLKKFDDGDKSSNQESKQFVIFWTLHQRVNSDEKGCKIRKTYSILDSQESFAFIGSIFKIFYVFNLQYPEESNIFYNFIQVFFYDMPKKKKYEKVTVIKN
ncbi:uncharacterized protein LOC142228924 [Haematobia irritans]|uniref:uncharacterized protein LOC142228924 n=1 Tax=Haematobia irritans TaxID=7368 RepID=UPI003F5065A5